MTTLVSMINRPWALFRLFVKTLPTWLLVLAGCVVASAPLKHPPRLVATPQPGQLSVAIQPVDTVGDVQPVYISIANGTDIPRAVVPSQIFALDAQGQRTAPLPPGEAAREAGGARELRAALASGAASGAVAGALGTGLGALAGSLIHSGTTGAAMRRGWRGHWCDERSLRRPGQCPSAGQRADGCAGAAQAGNPQQLYRKRLRLLPQRRLQAIAIAAGRSRDGQYRGHRTPLEVANQSLGPQQN